MMASPLQWIGRILKYGVLGIGGLLACVAVWARVARRSDAKLPAPGQLVEVEPGRQMHITCLGTGAPTVVLEAGLGDYGWSSWSTVQPQIAATTRTCSYDRAGTGWSDPPRRDPMPSAMVDDLRTLLTAAGERGPYVLVGHSLGGPLVRHYARRFPREVAGMVLVDGSHEDQLTRLPPLPKAAELVIAALPALHFLGLDRLAGAFAADTAAKTQVARQTSDLATANTTWIYEHLAPFLAQARDSGSSLGDVPLVVLTASTMQGPGMPPELAERFHAVWVTLNQEIATYSTRGQQRTVPGTTHYIQRDQPHAVIDAVNGMVRELRAATTPDTASSPSAR
ncbi:MAG: alpha/beta fold hydrolase [Gemmatimonadetes bacterium]|nr:alpha/beta fold hydrolase [Gemmatimonadota bacterium]